MLGTIGSFLVGRAAKAGVAALFGAVGAMGGAGVTEYVAMDTMPIVEGNLALWQYLAIGAASGFINWITTYNKANAPTDWQRQNGLY